MGFMSKLFGESAFTRRMQPNRRPSPGMSDTEWRKQQQAKHTPHLCAKMKSRDRYTCHLCGTVGAPHELQVSYKVSIKNGGATAPANLVTLCKACFEVQGIDWYM